MKKLCLVFLLVMFISVCDFAVAEGQFSFEWIGRYKGPGSNYGYPLFLEIDSLGNTYVCGISEAKPDVPYASGYIYNDIVVCKFNSAGKLIWFCRYNATDKVSDMPTGRDQ